MGEKYTAEKLKELCTDFLISNQAGGDLASKILDINLSETFKKRRDFKSDEEYSEYFRITVKPNMIVQHSIGNAGLGIRIFELGRVVGVYPSSVAVMWQTGTSNILSPTRDLHIVTPPINMKMFTNSPKVRVE